MEFHKPTTELQKLGYFAKESGYQNLKNVLFDKDMEGPYSKHIESFAKEMVPEYLQIITDDSQENSIEAIDQVAHKSSAMLEGNETALHAYYKIKDLISGYTHPYGMELLLLVHWAFKHENTNE